MRFVLLSAVAALASASPALAQSAPSSSPPDAGTATAIGDTITVGAAVVTLPDYEGSAHNHITGAPGALGSYKGFSFTLSGNRLSVNVIPSKPGPGVNLEFGPYGVADFNRSSVKSIDDQRIKRLGKLGTAIELGGYAGIGKTGVITSDYDRLSVSLSYRYDVNGVHRSGVLSPSINYVTPLSRKTVVGIYASAEHVERGYATTYFGITPGQALASGLPAYGARGGWKNYTLGALGGVSLTGDLTHGLKLVGGGTYSRLLNGFSYSPVVRIAGKPNQFLGLAGLAYTF